MKNQISKAVELLKSADCILVGAGSGMSADSGLQVFRGSQGLYSGTEDIEEIINPVWFKRNIDEAWKYYENRINLYRNTDPHQGYSALKAICEMSPLGYFIYTSNVDSHFKKAGFAADRIYEIHGNVECYQCLKPCNKSFFQHETGLFEVPRCPCCDGAARPNVLMFNDDQWVSKYTWPQLNRYQAWQRTIHQKKIIKIEIGVGYEITSIRDECKVFPGKLIRINPDADAEVNVLTINGLAKDILLELSEKLKI